MVRRIYTKAPAREYIPQQALVRAAISVCVRLDPRVAGREDCPFPISAHAERHTSSTAEWRNAYM